jgi:hypothetical protein
MSGKSIYAKKTGFIQDSTFILLQERFGFSFSFIELINLNNLVFFFFYFFFIFKVILNGAMHGFFKNS